MFEKMSAQELHEAALCIWDSARATLESGDRSDLSRLQIEDAFALFEDRISTLQREADGLREALEEIVAGNIDLQFNEKTDRPMWHVAFAQLQSIARAALNGSPQAEADKGSDRNDDDARLAELVWMNLVCSMNVCGTEARELRVSANDVAAAVSMAIEEMRSVV